MSKVRKVAVCIQCNGSNTLKKGFTTTGKRMYFCKDCNQHFSDPMHFTEKAAKVRKKLYAVTFVVHDDELAPYFDREENKQRAIEEALRNRYRI